jgi:hypothetical protein
MPSTTEKQQRYFFAVQRCKDEKICPSENIKATADSMTKKQIADFTKLKKSFKEWLEEREKFTF